MSLRYGKKWLRKAQRDLKFFQPNRRELNFEALLESDYPDETIEKLFVTLYLEICQFVLQGFGKDVFSKSQRSPWSPEYSAEFYGLVSKLARPGADPRQWDSLLRERSERCALLQGVILKALEATVFSSLLFGATSEHKKLLAVEDSSLIDVEGFRRTRLRAETNRLHLQSTDGMPWFFWKEVDRVTAQIMRMLLPVYSSIGHYIDGDNLHSSSQQSTTYQALHDLVAHAAWLSIAFRVSPKIVTWEWVRPGEPYKFEYYSIDSKKQQEMERFDPGEPRRQRVMVCAAPLINIHGNGTDGLLQGKVKFTIMRPQVVCYLGHRDDLVDERAMVPLHRHLRRTRAREHSVAGSIFWFLFQACLLGLVLVTMNAYFGRELETRKVDILEKVGLLSKHLASIADMKEPVASLSQAKESVAGGQGQVLPEEAQEILLKF
ncbi:hypothetical protein ESCO_002465 [Escovopsis weberi]|uniref:Uncharacterized protein n=1 Tax=Escovopsis weberi TaxID=150374 RepID=A0A0M8MVL9_ESCWE|nr:hypothetical protein ESCO_002465 [Escovopsis weberi]